MVRIPMRAFAGLSAMALLVASNSASAAVVQIRDAPGPGLSQILDGTASSILATTTGGPLHDYFVGVLDAELDSGSGFNPFLSFCIEPDAGIAYGPNPIDLVGASYTTDLLTNAGFTAQTADYAGILWSNAFGLATAVPEYAAAFQALLWEFSTDPSTDLTSGNFQLGTTGYTGSVNAIAQDWLGKITGGDWTSSTPLIAYINATGQNMIGPLDDISNVPEASTTALMLAAGAGALLWKRRRTKSMKA